MALYEEVASRIRARILAGEYEPGARLPTQRQLAQTWGIALPTMRQALDRLISEGLLRVEHGVGTFVADLDHYEEPYTIGSFDAALRERGVDVDTQFVTVSARTESDEAAAQLKLGEHEAMVVVARVRRIDDVPVVFQQSYLPGRYREQINGYLGDVPLYEFLQQRMGLLPISYVELLSAEAAPARVATALQLAPRAAVMVSRRTTYGPEGQPLVFDLAWLAPEQVQIRITRHGRVCIAGVVPRRR